jgi:DNA-binding beta-propeller fold protein YncE
MLRTLGFAIALLSFSSAAGAGAAPLPLDQVADVPLPGRPTRFDYASVDATQRRLYMTHLGDGALVVFDLDGRRVLQEIPGLPSVHGVVAAPDKHMVFATVTGDKTLALIDDRSFQVKARVPAGEYPNGLAYDPKTARVFVSNNSGLGLGVVDVNAAKPLPGIDIGGGAGNSQYDAETGHVLAAVHGRGYLVDVDPAEAKVVSRIPLPGVASCHGLHVVASLRLAFAVCRGAGSVLTVIDLRARKVLQSLPLPPDVDVLAFDSGSRRLYAASETGAVAVFAVAEDRSVTELGRGTLASNAHTVAVDPATHRVYFPLEDVGGKPILRIMQPR